MLGGSAITTWNPADLYYFNAIKYRGLPSKLGSATDNDYRRIAVSIDLSPLNTKDFVDTDYGLDRKGKSCQIRVTSPADGAMDSRINGCWVWTSGHKPDNYQGHRQYAYTATAGSDERIGLGKLANQFLKDIFGFITTNIDDGVTALTQTVESVKIHVNRKETVLHKIMIEAMTPFITDGEPTDEYFYFPLSPPLETLETTDVVCEGGDANAVRIYNGVLYPNGR